MKKTVIKSLLLACVGMALTAGSANATVITFTDSDAGEGLVQFPLAPTHGFSTLSPKNDEYYGQPHISKMTVEYNNATQLLQKVVIYSPGMNEYDSLFINNNWNGTAGTWSDWDFYVQYDYQGGWTAPHPTGIYSVDANYQYHLVPPSPAPGRNGHPAGIGAGATLISGVTYPFGFDGVGAFHYFDSAAGTLTYDFTKVLGLAIPIDTPGFSIAFSTYCANDLSGGGHHVPEPTSMLLLGTGLVGLAVLGRKNRAIKN